MRMEEEQKRMRERQLDKRMEAEIGADVVAQLKALGVDLSTLSTGGVYS